MICASSEYKELKWIAGEYYWMESVQSYNNDGWDYLTELRTFVDKGMTDQSFIDGVSGIVSRGCHNPVSIHNVNDKLFATDTIVAHIICALFSYAALWHWSLRIGWKSSNGKS